MVSKKGLGATENARTPEQIVHMENTVGKGKCPFCTGFNPEMNKVIPEIGEGKFWRAWHNPFPYPRHQAHIVLATYEHITFADLTGEMFAELGLMQQALIRDLDLPGGAVVGRFGDVAHNAGTLNHLHFHIQVPDLSGPTFAVFGKFPVLVHDNSEELAEMTAELVKAFTPPR